jgi:hypothetical protein
VLAVILFELRIIGHVGVHCNLLLELINGKCTCIADAGSLQETHEFTKC